MSSTHASVRARALPGEARARVLRQHAAIRVLLWSAVSIGPTLEKGQAEARAQLLNLIAELRRVLEDHLAYEEALLIPILEGEATDELFEARRLATEHARQRADLATLTNLAAAGDFPHLTRELSRFITNLTVDMEYEESTYLADDVLHTGARVAEPKAV